MALIDNTAEIKSRNSAISLNIELANIQSFIDDAIDKHLIPAIGRTQFDALVAGKDGYTDGSKEKTLLILLQKATAGFMLAYYSNTGSLEISNTGIHVSTSTTKRPASDKKLMILRRQSFSDGYGALELAVNYLEVYLNDFPIYKASDEHFNNRALILNTSSEFQLGGVNIGNSAHLYQVLRIYQSGVEVNTIDALLGTSLTDKLRGLVLNGGGTIKEKLLIKKLYRPIAYFTMAEAIPYIAISIDPTGIYELSETVGGISGNVENRSAAQEKRLQNAMNALIMSGEAQLETIKQWVIENKTDFMDFTVPEDVNINDGSAPNLYYL